MKSSHGSGRPIGGGLRFQQPAVVLPVDGMFEGTKIKRLGGEEDTVTRVNPYGS